MKITLDCIIYGLQKFGGISTYWRGLSAYLSRAPEVELTLRLPRNARLRGSWLPAGSSAAAVRIDALPAMAARYLPVFVDGSTDLHHTSYYRSTISARARSVVTVHDFTYEKFRRGLPRVLHSIQKASAIRRANGIICVSQNTRRDLLNWAAGIDPEHVVVIPLGVDAEHFYPLADNEGDASLSDVVLFVGQRSGYKRFDLAVRALRPLTDLRLGVVGPPLSNNELAMLNYTLGSRWVGFGSVSTEALRVLYGSCFAYIYTSSYEGFGLPILEAMSCGTPPVVANLSSFPEVGGAAALYAQDQTPEAYTQALQSLMRPEFRETKIRQGLAHVKAFSWERTFECTLEFYKKVLS